MSLKFENLLVISLIVLGLLLRFYYQFVNWSFNGDEINLGLDIITHPLNDLFYPFENMQSAPPLFLLLEKFISEIAKPYISLKFLSFASSCTSVFLFNRLLKNSFRPAIHIILLALFCFNPFIISNSLTLKQYTFDLTLGLVAINYFYNQKGSYKAFLFYSIFCLVSNVGLFFSAALVILKLFKNTTEEVSEIFSWKSLNRIVPFLLAPIPYILFYFWFIAQPFAGNLKSYMVNYWDGSFLPLDFSVIKWIAIQGKMIYFFFFSTYWFIGIPMLLIFMIGLLFIVKNRKKIFEDKPLGLITVYIIVVGIHLILSALKMYPFSDRLFLYLAPGIYLIVGYGINCLYSSRFLLNRSYKLLYSAVLVVPICSIMFFFSYLPNKSNDVIGLVEFVNDTDKIVKFTPQAKQFTLNWLNFTKYYNQKNPKIIKLKERSRETRNADLLIAIQNEKFGHSSKYTKPNQEVQQLLIQNQVSLYKRIPGFVIYKYN